MKTIELFGQVDESHRLSAQLPAEVPAGPIKFALLLDDVKERAMEDEAGSQWVSGISKQWADDLADSRQDLYSLSDGGTDR